MENEPTLADGVAGRARSDDHVGRFRVVGKLGEGGMGVVYEAHDPQLDRRVAIKLVRVDGDAQGRARLLREAQAMAKVAHPNVVPIYEVGEHHGQVFVAMELVPGETLEAWVTREPRPWRDALAIYVAAGRGLAAAHATGIVHRDFKPDNVLVGGDGRPRVLDFGLARGIHHAGDDAPATTSGSVLHFELTVAGSMMGTPGFMSPEHFRGDGIGPASDQFGFAVAVYRALYGEMPFPGKTLAELRDAVCTGAPKPPHGDADLPAAVTAAVLRALATDPTQRFPSMDALLAELDRPLRVDPDHDLNRGRAARKVVAGAIAVAALTGIVVGGATGMTMTPAWALAQSAVALAIILALGVAARRALAASAHNRRVGVLIAATCVALVVHRALALHIGAPALDTLVGDGVMVALATTLAGVTLERWMLGGAVLALGYVGFAVAVPSDAGMGFGALMLSYAAAAAWRWSR